MVNKNTHENPFLANPNAIIDLIRIQANESCEESKSQQKRPVVKQKALGSFNGSRMKGAKRHG